MDVLQFRWRRQLYSNTPDFIIPQFYERYDRFQPVETAGAAFDTDRRRVFIGAAVGGFYCLDAGTGKTVWRRDFDDPIGSTPVYDSARSRVYVGADDGFLHAFHSRSGRRIWTVDTGAELRRNIWMVADTLFAVNADNTVVAVDPQGGEIVWRYRRSPVEGFSSVSYADLNLVDGTIYAGFSDGILAAIDAGTGQEKWTADLAAEVVASAGGEDVLLVDVDATPVVAGNRVIAATLTGGVQAVDAASGSLLWTRPDLDMVTGLAFVNGEVQAVRAGDRGLVSLSVETGETLLESRFGLGLKFDPVVYDDLLLIPDTEAGLYMVSAGTGRVLNLLDVNGGFFARPTIHAGYLLIMGNWTTLFSFAIN